MRSVLWRPSSHRAGRRIRRRGDDTALGDDYRRVGHFDRPDPVRTEAHPDGRGTDHQTQSNARLLLRAARRGHRDNPFAARISGFVNPYYRRRGVWRRVFREWYTARSKRRRRCIERKPDRTSKADPTGESTGSTNDLTGESRTAVIATDSGAGFDAKRRKLVRRTHFTTIVAAWVITVPAAALLAAVFFIPYSPH